MSERGAGGVAMLAVALVVALLAAGIADVGGYLAARAQAAAAADAAALAAAPVTFRPFGAVGSPAQEAAALAAANGTRLTSCVCPVDRSWAPRRVEVAVVVSVDLMLFGSQEVGARSAAEFIPVRLPGD